MSESHSTDEPADSARFTAPDLFGAALERERKNGELVSPRRIAEVVQRAGIPVGPEAIYRYIKGKDYPREELLVAICEALVNLRGIPKRDELPHATLARARMLFDERLIGLDAALANLEALHITSRRLRALTMDMDAHRVAHQWVPGPREPRRSRSRSLRRSKRRDA